VFIRIIIDNYKGVFPNVAVMPDPGGNSATKTLLIIVAATMSMIAFSILPDGDPFRILLVLPLIIFLPGHSLLVLIFPRVIEPSETMEEDSEKTDIKRRTYHKGKGRMVKIEVEDEGGGLRIAKFLRFSLSFPLSVALRVTFAFIYDELYVLDREVFGLRPVPVLVTLYVITVFSALGSMALNIRKREDRKRHIVQDKKKDDVSDPISKGITFLLSVVLVLSVLLTFYNIYIGAEDENVKLYLLGKGGEIDSYPDLVLVNEVNSIIAGVDNVRDTQGLRLMISTLDEIGEFSTNFSDPQVFNSSTKVVMDLPVDRNDRIENWVNFSFDGQGRYSMTFYLLDDDVVIRKVWINIIVFAETNYLKDPDDLLEVYLTSRSGTPLIGEQITSSEAPLSFRLTVENHVIEVFRMNTTIYLESVPQLSYQQFRYNYSQPEIFPIEPGNVLNNYTIVAPRDTVWLHFGILVPKGTWTLRIGINEFSSGAVIKVDVVSI